MNWKRHTESTLPYTIIRFERISLSARYNVFFFFFPFGFFSTFSFLIVLYPQFTLCSRFSSLHCCLFSCHCSFPLTILLHLWSFYLSYSSRNNYGTAFFLLRSFSLCFLFFFYSYLLVGFFFYVCAIRLFVNRKGYVPVASFPHFMLQNRFKMHFLVVTQLAIQW